MHELSIAHSIITSVETVAREKKAKKITKIHLQIGSLAGIEMDALKFSWKIAVQNTMLEKAETVFEVVSAKAKCLECQSEFSLKNHYDACPHCNSYFKQIIQGKELKIKYIEIE